MEQPGKVNPGALWDASCQAYLLTLSGSNQDPPIVIKGRGLLIIINDNHNIIIMPWVQLHSQLIPDGDGALIDQIENNLSLLSMVTALWGENGTPT